MASRNIAVSSPVLQFKPFPRSSAKRRRPKSTKAAASDNWVDFVDTEVQNTCVQHLLECARGVSLVLNSLRESEKVGEVEAIASGLASALQCAADSVECHYFRSPGALAHTLDSDTLAALLKRELRKIEARP